MLLDAMDALYSCGLKGKLYRLIYMLNKDTIIKVNTGVGMSDERETGENVGQGTIEGALVSAANIDVGVKSVFKDSDKDHVIESKLLDFNLTKSCFIVVGPEKLKKP